MALRTWGRVLFAAMVVGVLAGACQLGVAFGLGIVRLGRTFTAADENQWTAQLAWVTWFAMVAAVAGAVTADRMARRHRHVAGNGSRVAYAAVAGLGAAAVAPLCMLPARSTEVPTGDPVLIIGLSAALGALAGVFAALAVLSQEALFWNTVVITAGGWLLALISVVPSLSPSDPLPAVRLGVLDPASLSAGTAQQMAVVTMPILALLAGASTAGLGRWLGRPPMAIAASGLVGPAMLSLAYLIAGPGSDVDKYQAGPYWGALVAVGAGPLGSVLATVVRRPAGAEEPIESAPATEPTPPTGSPESDRADRPAADQQPAAAADHQPAATPAERPATDQAAEAPAPAAADQTPTRPTGPTQVARDPVSFAEAATAFAAGRRAATSGDATPTPEEPPTKTETPARTRRGLFGRRRAKARTEPVEAPPRDPDAETPPQVPTQRGDRSRPEPPLKPKDEEHVNWVSDLAAMRDNDLSGR